MIDHMAAAKAAFNHTWELIEADRDDEANLMMVGSALASWYHWRQVGDAKNFAISDWQVSRVLALVGDSAGAMAYGRMSLRSAEDGGLGAFYVAYAHEAMARAASVGEADATEVERHLEAARALLDDMSSEERQLIEDDLATI